MKISYENLPCIVMTRISPNCLTETRHGSIQLFCEYILMSKQCVGICEPLINLNCTLEKSDSCIMFLLQAEAVSSSTPRLKGSLAKKFPINQNSWKDRSPIFFFSIWEMSSNLKVLLKKFPYYVHTRKFSTQAQKTELQLENWECKGFKSFEGCHLMLVFCSHWCWYSHLWRCTVSFY